MLRIGTELGSVKSFTVGSRELSSYSATRIGETEPTTVDEAERLFHRLDGRPSDPFFLNPSRSGIATNTQIMTTGATFFAPLGASCTFPQGRMGAVRVSLSDGSERMFANSAFVRTVSHPNGVFATALTVGDVLDDDQTAEITSVERVDNVCYTRPPFEWNYAHGDERVSNLDTDDSTTIGLTFRLVQPESNRGYVFFDDARLEVSNIMWDYSPDSGNTWYSIFALPNQPYMRLSLPSKTNQVRVRATSRSDEEWVRGYSIHPKPSWKLYPAPTSEPKAVMDTPMSWRVTHPVSSPIFSSINVDAIDGMREAYEAGHVFDMTNCTIEDMPDGSVRFTLDGGFSDSDSISHGDDVFLVRLGTTGSHGDFVAHYRYLYEPTVDLNSQEEYPYTPSWQLEFVAQYDLQGRSDLVVNTRRFNVGQGVPPATLASRVYMDYLPSETL